MGKKKSPNDKSFRNRADKIFMKRFHGMPCEVCGNTEGTHGHHVICKSRSKALRYDIRNIIVVCSAHHTMGNDMAPHSLNQKAVERFIGWFKDAKPGQYKWITENEYIKRRYTFQQACENLENGLSAWA